MLSWYLRLLECIPLAAKGKLVMAASLLLHAVRLVHRSQEPIQLRLAKNSVNKHSVLLEGKKSRCRGNAELFIHHALTDESQPNVVPRCVEKNSPPVSDCVSLNTFIGLLPWGCAEVHQLTPSP